MVGQLHPRVRGASISDARGMATAELKLPWSGGHLGGRSSTEDGRGVAVKETPEVLLAGTAEGASTETPEALLAGTAELLMTVTGIPEAVDMEIPKATTSCCGRCLGGRPRANAGAVSTQGNWKRWRTDATWDPGPGVNGVLTAC